MRLFVADLDELESVVSSLAACHVRLAQLGDEMGRAQHVGQASWDGAAAGAQAAAHADWQAGLTGMREALDAMRAAAGHAHQRYAAAVDLNVAMWRQLA